MNCAYFKRVILGLVWDDPVLFSKGSILIIVYNVLGIKKCYKLKLYNAVTFTSI